MRSFPLFFRMLKLNKEEDNKKVARKKMFQYFFNGNFDVTPFSKMHNSLIARIMTQIKSENKLCALYKLLQCMIESPGDIGVFDTSYDCPIKKQKRIH